MPDITARLGIVNREAFFSPYYFFDLLAHQQAEKACIPKCGELATAYCSETFRTIQP